MRSRLAARIICCALPALFVCFTLRIVWAQGIQQGKNESMKLAFEEEYKAWNNYIYARAPLSSVMLISTLTDNEPYRELINLGLPILPYVMEKLSKDFKLEIIVENLTKKNFHFTRTGEEDYYTVEEFPDIKQKTRLNRRMLWLRWWNEGRKQTPQQFEKLYQEWKSLKKKGKTEEAEEKYQRVKDLGITALPYMIEKIEQGDSELIPALSELTDGQVDKNVKKEECLSWWKKNKDKWTLPPVESKEQPAPPGTENGKKK